MYWYCYSKNEMTIEKKRLINKLKGFDIVK